MTPIEKGIIRLALAWGAVVLIKGLEGGHGTPPVLPNSGPGTNPDVPRSYGTIVK